MKKKYSDFMLNEQDTSTAVAPITTKKDDVVNDSTSINSVNPDVSGDKKITTEQDSGEEKKEEDDVQPENSISNFDKLKGEEIIKKISDFWINKVITENQLNFSGNTLKTLYKKEKNPKYSKYKQTINEVIADKTADCTKKFIDSDAGDMFFYKKYPVKLVKKGLEGNPSIISFFKSNDDNDYNSKLKEIINSKEYVDSSNLEEYQKKLKLEEFELMTDIDEEHIYMYKEQPVEFKIENGEIKSMIDADTNKNISLYDENNKPIFDITKLKKYNKSDKSNTSTSTTTNQSSRTEVVTTSGTTVAPITEVVPISGTTVTTVATGTTVVTTSGTTVAPGSITQKSNVGTQKNTNIIKNLNDFNKNRGYNSTKKNTLDKNKNKNTF